MSDDGSTISFLTLNCWGVPSIGSKKRRERMIAIGQELASRQHDILLLEEVWLDGDFEVLRASLASIYPHYHHFTGGLLGTGLVVFAKYPMEELQYFPFKLNGFPHKVAHGDFYANKGLGLCILQCRGFKLHLYITHLHAEYNRENDEYLSHRIEQCFSTGSIIRRCSLDADVVVLGGDLNLEPDDLGLQILLERAQLRDSWLERPHADDSIGATCDTPSNSFVSEKVRKQVPNGKRIDYILFKGGKETQVECVECNVTLGRVPGKSFNFSDHEAVLSRLCVKRQIGGSGDAPVGRADADMYSTALQCVQGSRTSVLEQRRRLLTAVLLVVGLFYLIEMFGLPLSTVYAATLKILLVCVGFYCFIYGFVIKTSEERGLRQLQCELNVVAGKSKAA